MDEVELIIENEKIKCNRNFLITNSDYFKAMFKGNFIESNQNIIKLKNVNITIFKLILEIINDKDEEIINEDNIYPLLETALMLQFSYILNMISNIFSTKIRITEKNCIEIWLALKDCYETLSLKDYYCKVKSITSVNFYRIGFSRDRLASLNLDNICDYLGNVNLKINNEKDVLNSILLWYEINSELVNTFENHLKLLSCVDFKTIECSEIEEVMKQHEILGEHEILSEIMNCIIKLKNNLNSFEEFDKDKINKIQLLLKSESRLRQEVPCLVFSHRVISQAVKSIVYYDLISRKLKMLINIPYLRIGHLEGHQIMSYKNFFYFFGGIYDIDFFPMLMKCNFIQGKIEEIELEHTSDIPIRRKNFQSIAINNIVYIIKGQTEDLEQENMFWFDLDDPTPKVTVESIPCYNTAIQTCNFQDKLLLLDNSFKNIWLFDHEKHEWTAIPIHDPNPNSPDSSFQFPKNVTYVTIYAYNNYLYIKGKFLFKLKLNDTQSQFIIVDKYNLCTKPYVQIFSVLCKNIVYTLYKHPPMRTETSEEARLSLEILYLNTLEKEFVFENIEPFGKFSFEDIEINSFLKSCLLTISRCSNFDKESDEYINKYFLK